MPAFAQRFLFPPEIGVDQPKQAPYSAIIRLGFDDFLRAPRVQRQKLTVLCLRLLSSAR